ncbi:hypothetical protein [Mycobacterium sp. 1274761.0]|uniref:hypothetical protein n=1 Tax=Mycobacterium sp. 1274761.0 TaxID=1834077 RepID=UPI0007FF9BFD|nr:hypothetical protein [Mycobacterium sp. 1274761.0]OBK77573.1 hypothetical protein A5651_04060 [Mycobacterium sp. 1274761.0]
MTSTTSKRSYAPLTRAHLGRLGDLANQDHRKFTRSKGRPEYRHRRVAVVLAQGAALHFVNKKNGVKDLDVWTFYAAIPGKLFRFGQRKVHVDFGVSEHGRNKYPPGFKHPQLKRWLQFRGRRVDFMIRSLPVAVDAPSDEVVAALRSWLSNGARLRRREDEKMPSNWWLAQKAVVMIEPLRGQVIWPV